VNIEKQNKVRHLFLNIKSFYFEEKNNIASDVIQQIETDILKKKNNISYPPQRVGFTEIEHVNTEVASMLLK
jgi:hypothetical protein